MPHATRPGGQLVDVKDCYIKVSAGGSFEEIPLRILPDISDSKSASYNDEPIVGRSFPMKTFSHSENRVISMQAHFITLEEQDVEKNLRYLRLLESAVYPRTGENGAPFLPPPICTIKCGRLLADEELCVILKSYSVKFPTDVAWYGSSYMPQKFEVDLSWEVVYRTSELPGQDRILDTGR